LKRFDLHIPHHAFAPSISDLSIIYHPKFAMKVTMYECDNDKVCASLKFVFIHIKKTKICLSSIDTLYAQRMTEVGKGICRQLLFVVKSLLAVRTEMDSKSLDNIKFRSLARQAITTLLLTRVWDQLYAEHKQHAAQCE